MSVVEFYKNQEIFITGGTGFIGKALIEKILRTSPDVSKIFLLLRGKRGQNVDVRLRELMDSVIFNTIREKHPGILDKVVAIEGDCRALHLGIKNEDLEKIKNVSIIFHVAATVRFDEDLRDAMFMNTRGTLELLKISENFKNLKSFVHVSTAYSNADRPLIGEKLYPPLTDWRQSLKLAENADSNMLNIFTAKYINQHPNTYTFTKNLAEHVVNDYRNKLPVIIFRPSIVMPAIDEPCPGFIDNFNGLGGVWVGSGSGVLKTFSGDGNTTLDMIPVDCVVRAMLLACYKCGTELHLSPKNEVDVINCTGSQLWNVINKQLFNILRQEVNSNPFERTIWAPSFLMTTSKFLYKIRFIFLQLLLAIVGDSLLFIFKQKTMLIKLQRSIHMVNLRLQYFAGHVFTFQTDKMHALEQLLPNSEYDKFSFLKYANMDYQEYCRKGLCGVKFFLLNDPPQNTKGAMIRYRILKVINLLLQSYCGWLITQFAIGTVWPQLKNYWNNQFI